MVRTGGDCQTEAAACRGIKESGVARRGVLVVSSLRNVDSRDAAAHQIDKLLESLDSSYIDFIIMEASPLFAVEAEEEREMRRLISVAGFSLSADEMKTIEGMNLRQSYSDPMYIR